ncbi:MAG: glycine--tRNA ligase [Clostridiales bacterium]|jgi:glycyl-tRNA synthetase|nr:glycine--tRNA ligase [Clostridiales bacterium]HOK81239.1 glycine--tRNA ligase [Clostridia bacterium]HOL60358.1 glycine--tRNA ligase [Clostridia bacterium]HPO53115.1 glycine--tRNA ligase [Clostridia bacterium]
MSKLTMDKLVALCKGRGFIFPGSEIYGGLANTWDYGPLGVELKNNIKRAWWKKFVQESEYNVGVDCAILMNPTVWEASGHLSGFSDPLMDCKECRSRHRADNLIEDYIAKNKLNIKIAGWTNEQMEKYIADNKVKCPVCGNSNFTGVRKFNLMFKTFQGVTEDSASTVYLRPETAQGIFVNFNNVLRSSRCRVPFGIAQVGKSFRNEITPGNFIFRTREFEQMELEFFCKPGTDLEWFAYWKNFCHQWLLGLGIKPENLRLRDHDKEELSHYSNATTDFEFLFPFGWGELWGIADRTDFDLKAHANKSGKSFEYTDPVTNEKYIPYCIEPSLGVERSLLAFLCNAYEEEDLGEGDTRVVLRLHHALAPYKVAVLPLQKKQLGEKAEEVYRKLIKKFPATYDETGSIGKRYRRQDEIGTPYCVTVDFDTLEQNTVTVRDRDTMEQVRLPIDELVSYFEEKLQY